MEDRLEQILVRDNGARRQRRLFHQFGRRGRRRRRRGRSHRQWFGWRRGPRPDLNFGTASPAGPRKVLRRAPAVRPERGSGRSRLPCEGTTRWESAVRVRGSVVVITGAASGIGRATALRFASQGPSSRHAGRRCCGPSWTSAGSGARALAVPTDVTDPRRCRRWRSVRWLSSAASTCGSTTRR
ncbi:SDR family NAD(P)-dependent oxidoreductase [Georgenia sp. AZ-5]|uniref:SDR family NAD(P)-dependent oxidoreductase n=1 Tax=Georgenia sp. AZ-5 TaxID=3367526 RepID=UPI0037541266